jgi:hypothetical protein
MQQALRSFRDAKPSFLWRDARDPKFDSERNGHGVPFTSIVAGPTEFFGRDRGSGGVEQGAARVGEAR